MELSEGRHIEMDAESASYLEDILDNLYENWRQIRRETLEQLGRKESLKIIDFHANNWIDIVRWISSRYGRTEQTNLVLFQFSRLFKELYWLQFLFHTGNYPTAYRNLRYILEMISQAYYIDTRYPALTLDQQIEEARELEEKRIYGWIVIRRALCKALGKAEQEIQARFKPLWDDLNKYAHPSARQMDWVAEEDFSALVTDSFNESLAMEFLAAIDRVFDIVYAVVLQRFSKAKSVALQHEFLNEWEKHLPMTISIIRQ